MPRKYKYKKGSKVRKAKQMGGEALLVPPEQVPISPIAEDIPKNQLKKGQVYRVGPRITPSLKEWDGKGFINL